MKTTALITVILFTGWTLTAQEISELSGNLQKVKKEVQQLRGNDQKIRGQIKELKTGLAFQQQLTSGISALQDSLQVKIDSLNNLQKETKLELLKADEQLTSTLNRLMVITLVGLFLLVLLLVIFIVQHRRMHDERSKRLEAMGADLRREGAEELKKVEDILLQRIELLEEKVY